MRFTPTGVGTTGRHMLTVPPPSVHPHGRGDNTFCVILPNRGSGSPPRAWGQRAPGRGGDLWDRFTPTGVGTTIPPDRPTRPSAVHPHGRGDNAEPGAMQCCVNGSPPRAWGQPRRAVRFAAIIRFTPTGVGTTRRRPGRVPALPVHPHGRGDNSERPRWGPRAFGSPPRAWGQLLPSSDCRGHRRFTPTGVGTTAGVRGWFELPAVHPHGRGDNGTSATRERTVSGSPPRAWGQRCSTARVLVSSRFTPTGVGTTPAPAPGSSWSPVHPHGRGDNTSTRSTSWGDRGSPPRAWGQRHPPHLPLPLDRFTPTGVGTTVPNADLSAIDSVHPHGRGDNKVSSEIGDLGFGSPPRAWGQRPRLGVGGGVDRFTPTGVGTTARRGRFPCTSAVHPHGRGDNATPRTSPGPWTGSPPRAWGQRDAGNASGDGNRFTPTGVGTTRYGRSAARDQSVHPHGRGDNGEAGEIDLYVRGSPPRAWGQRRGGGDRSLRPRFTPTGVGTTSRRHQ